MNTRIRQTVFIVLFWSLSFSVQAQDAKWIITGSAGPLWTEPCLVSFILAAERGADTIRLPVALSGDNQVVIIEDPLLTALTDATVRFSDRVGDDGDISTTDLSLAELRQLDVTAPSESGTGITATCTIATLSEALDFLQRIEQEQEHRIGIVVELRKPWLHAKEGKELGPAVLAALSNRVNQNQDARPPVVIAAYDSDVLQRLHDSLPPETDDTLGFMQLIDRNDGNETMNFAFGTWQPANYDWLFTRSGLRSIAGSIDAVGIPAWLLRESIDLDLRAFVDDARAIDMSILIYPADPLAEAVPEATDSVDAARKLLFDDGFDGLLTNHYRRINESLGIGASTAATDDGKHPGNIDRLIEHIERSDLDSLIPSRAPILTR